MKTSKYIAILFLCAIFTFLCKSGCMAAPAYNGVVKIDQPNGSVFDAKFHGDEWSNWTTTASGDSVIVKDKDGYWKYGEISFGKVNPSSAKVGIDPKPQGTADSNELINSTNILKEKSVMPKKYYSSGEPGPQASIAPKPAGSTQKILVLLVSFTDATIKNTESAWSNLFFAGAGTSVNSFYRENSSGSFSFAPASESYGTANDGIVKVSLGYAHPNTGASTDDRNRQIVKNALVAADPYVNFASYDTNGNGYIESDELHIVTITAGYERSCGTSTPNVWGHRWSLFGTVAPPQLDGEYIAASGYGGYTQQGEIHSIYGDHMAVIGILCHELGHDLGLFDEYNTSNSSDPSVGASSVMANGSWGMVSGGYPGGTPTHIDPWSKIYLGFVTPTVVSTGTQTMKCATTGSYNVLKVETSDPNQFFLIENRNLSGFDRGLYYDSITSGGIAIWHIDESVINAKWFADTVNNDPSHRGVDIEFAASRTYPYFYSSGNTDFMDSTSPNSKLYSGVSSNVKVKVLDAIATSMRVQIGDPGSVGFPASTYSINEGAGTLSIPVTRGSSSGALDVDYDTLDGTAMAGSDYQATSGTLHFNDGQSTNYIFITINDDGICEPAEAFTVKLSNASSGTIATGSTTVTITDDDPSPTMAFDTTAYSFGEAAGNAILTVNRTGNTAGTVTLDYSTSNGTAAAGSDYTAESGTLTFADGETSKTISVPIINDSVHEGNENFKVLLSSPSIGTITTPTATVTIVDDDAAPAQLAFNPSSYSVNENGGSINLTVDRTVNTAGTLTVNYATADGTATAGSDYTAKSGVLTFAAGETSKTITIPILDDATYEGNENFTVTLSGASSGTITTSAATVTINENDPAPQISFGSPTYSVAENGGSINVTVNRTANTAGALTVNYATSNGSAAAGSDYTAESGTLTFADGEASKTITIPILDDATYEGDESFVVTLSSPSVGTITTGTTTVTINENDPVPPQISFSPTSYSVSENGGSITLHLKRTGDTSAAVSVDYATADWTALAGGDYTASSGTVTFNSGETDKTIVININDDGNTEVNEVFKVKINNPTGGATVISGEADVTITDNDGLAPSGKIVKLDNNVSGGTIGCSTGSTQTITVYAVYENGAYVDVTALGTWSSDDTEVATVNAGVISGHASGIADITFTYGGETYTFSYTVK